MGEPPVKELYQLLIWQRFKAEASSEQITRVEKLVEIAKGRLLQIRDTFPAYTIHDYEHADNVVRLMGELLGDGVNKLTALEAALLILSAYFHDVGMAFSEEECLQLRQEEHFSQFLKERPAALVTLERSETDGLPDDIAEWYCRWRHADRLFEVFNGIRKENPDIFSMGISRRRRGSRSSVSQP